MLQFTPMGAVINYLKEVRFELSKVIWPKRKEVIKLTLIVLLISGIIGVYVGVVDLGFTKLLESIISK